MKRSTRSVYGVTGLMLVVLSVPFASALLKGTGGHYSETLQDQALGNQAELKATRRALTRLNARCGRIGTVQDTACKAYAIVQQECFDRQQKYFQDTGCPTINDMVRISEVQKALDSKKAVPDFSKSSFSSSSPASAHAAAVSSAATTFNDLSLRDQNAIRQAVRVKYCSVKLPQALYLICSALVGEDRHVAPTGFGNDLQILRSTQHSSRPSTLNDRIEMTVPVKR